MQFIDDDTIASVLHMEDLIPAMRQAMIDYSQGRVSQPPRRILDVKPHGGYFGSMPAVSADAMGAKLIAFYPDNADAGIATHLGLIALFKPETGEPLAMMDGGLITKMRTAAVTATFIDALAAENVRSLAILGAGAQGQSHFDALSKVRNFDDIRIWNRTRARAERFAERIGGRASSREDAVRDADVVVTATASSEPVLDGSWLKPGTKVASVGWAGADSGELDATTMSNIVIVDSREGALTESGNVRRCNAAIMAELGEILDGSQSVDREATVVFESIGMACQDIAAAALVLRTLT